MRKYTFSLLKAFHKLCQDGSNKTAIKRRALGLAIVIESGLDIKLKSKTGSYLSDSPIFSEIASSFKELIEKGWVEEITIQEDEEFFHFNDYKEYIMKAGLSHYSNPVNIKNELSYAVWPLGNNWFSLTSAGEDFLEDNKKKSKLMDIFTLKPNFFGLSADLKKFISWLKSKLGYKC